MKNERPVTQEEWDAMSIRKLKEDIQFVCDAVRMRLNEEISNGRFIAVDIYPTFEDGDTAMPYYTFRLMVHCGYPINVRHYHPQLKESLDKPI